ncbi:hypothetical protein PFISCL1PPCAC_5633, partial [Pristionchus fissidentatus]
VSTACGLFPPQPYPPHYLSLSIVLTLIPSTMVSNESDVKTARECSRRLATSCRSVTTSSKRSTTTSTTLLQHGTHTQPTTCCTLGCPTKANWIARLLLHLGGYNRSVHHHNESSSSSSVPSSSTSSRHHQPSQSARNPSV